MKIQQSVIAMKMRLRQKKKNTCRLFFFCLEKHIRMAGKLKSVGDKIEHFQEGQKFELNVGIIYD